MEQFEQDGTGITEIMVKNIEGKEASLNVPTKVPWVLCVGMVGVLWDVVPKEHYVIWFRNTNLLFYG